MSGTNPSAVPAESSRQDICLGKRTIEEISASLKARKATMQWHANMMLAEAIGIGRDLVEAKALLPYGQWGEYLEKEAEFSQSTANNYMKLFEEYGAQQQSLFGAEANSQALGNLSYTKALKLLALPAGEREEFVAENDVESMSTRELERAIKEREEALADKRQAEQARQKMEEDMKRTGQLLESAKQEAQAAAEKAAQFARELEELKAAPIDVAIAEVDQAALDKARAEGEAAKAEEIAQLQAKLDKAKEAKKKSDEKREQAEAAVETLKLQLEEAAKAQTKAVIAADPEVAKFEVYFMQAQETANKMYDLLLKARDREDQTSAEKLSRALLALADKIRGCAG